MWLVSLMLPARRSENNNDWYRRWGSTQAVHSGWLSSAVWLCRLSPCHSARILTKTLIAIVSTCAKWNFITPWPRINVSRRTGWITYAVPWQLSGLTYTVGWYTAERTSASNFLGGLAGTDNFIDLIQLQPYLIFSWSSTFTDKLNSGPINQLLP